MPANVKAGGAYIELFAKDSRMMQAIDGASSGLNSLGTKLVGIGAKLGAAGLAATSTLVAAAVDFAHAGATIDDASTRTGTTAEALSSLAHAAQQSGADLAGLESGLIKMQKNITAAADGSAGAVDAFDSLGLKWQDLAGMTPDEQFKTLADKLATIENPARRAATAMEIFGKGGATLLPLLAEGREGIEKLQEESHALGITWNTEDAKSAAEFDDGLDRLNSTLKRTWQAVGAALAPALTNLAGIVTDTAADVKQWLDANRPLVVSLAAGAAAVTALGGALIIAGGAVVAIGAVIGGLGTILTTAGAAIGILMTPLGALTAAVATFGAVYVTEATNTAEATNWLADHFGPLRDDATGAFSAIADALAAGDISTAAKQLWSFLQTVWHRGKVALFEIWNSLATDVATRWEKVKGDMATGWIEFTAGIEIAWISATSTIGGLWEDLQDSLRQMWAGFFGWFEDKFLALIGFFEKLTSSEEEAAAIDKKTAEARAVAAAANNAAATTSTTDPAGRQSALNDQLAAIGKRTSDQIAAAQADAGRATAAAAANPPAQLDLVAAQQELADSLAEFRQQMDTAAQARADRPGGFDLAAANIDTEALLTGSGDKSSVSGTFSATAAAGLATEPAQETNRILRRIEQQGQLAFR